jgi:hypothetical protein
MKPLLLWKSNKYYIFGCVFVRVRVRVRVLVSLLTQHVSACSIFSSVPSLLHQVFRHCLINGMIFEKKSC